MSQLSLGRPISLRARPSGASRALSIAARLDYLLLLPTLALSGLGVLMVYSVTRPHLLAAGLNPTHYLQLQATYVALGAGALAATVRFHYHRYAQIATLAYAGMFLGLLAVLSPVGSSALGSQRWLALGPFDLQPSAFAALSLVLAAAAYCHRRRDRGLGPRQLGLLLAATIPAMLLVIKQPDLGTAITMAVVLLAILSVAGLPGRWIALLVLLTIAAVVAVIQMGLLHKYQLQRLTSFLNQGGPGANQGVISGSPSRSPHHAFSSQNGCEPPDHHRCQLNSMVAACVNSPRRARAPWRCRRAESRP